MPEAGFEPTITASETSEDSSYLEPLTYRDRLTMPYLQPIPRSTFFVEKLITSHLAKK
jgi:hypothetical protein